MSAACNDNDNDNDDGSGDGGADAVLLVAYQCGPGLGSVSQIGWQWFTGMAQRRPVCLVTHVRNRAAIDAAPDKPADARVIYIDTEWFAGPLYRLSKRLFPRSEHGVFLLSQLDWFVFDAVALRTLRRERSAGAPWRLLHLVTPVSVSATSRLHRLGLPVVRGPLNSGLPVPPGFAALMRDDAMGLSRLRVLPRLAEALTGSLRRSAAVLVATAATRAALPRAVRARCTAMLENAVDPQRFTPPPLRPVRSSGQPLRLSFVGRLVPVKALPLLLQAMARLRAEGRQLQLAVAGDGPMAARWRDEAQALGLADSVQWHGALGAEAVAALMAGSDVFCLPSVRESGGAVLLEAMACGRPVIGMDFGGPAEIVDAAVGWRVAMPDAAAAVDGLAQALREAHDDPAGAARRGDCARQRVLDHHTWQARLAAAERIYGAALRPGPAAAKAQGLQSCHNGQGQAACNGGMPNSTPTLSPAPAATPLPAAAGGATAYLVSRYPAVSHTFILREVQGLRALGLRVEVASVNPPDRETAQMTADERAEAAATYGLKQHGARGALVALAWAAATRPLALARTLREALCLGRGLQRVYALAYAVEALMLARWMAQRGLQHLHVHFGNEAAAVGLLVKRFSGAGLSLTIHGPDEFDDVPGQHLRRKVERADQVVCISQFARSQLMRLTAPVHWAKLQLCRLGVDPVGFAPRTAARAAGPVRLLSVGRLTPAKGQWLLLQACAALQASQVAFELTVVGDGPDRAALQAAVARHGLQARVRFTGALNQPQVRAELARADVFVLPSLAEGIPVVLMEAMASGVPCVSSPVNGIPELIEHGRSGLLATPGDVDALTRQLRRVIEDDALRLSLAAAGRDQVEQRFHLARNVAQLADILRGLPAVQSPRPWQGA